MSSPFPLTVGERNIFPYFQPIVGADQRSIIGYEILGRYLYHDAIYSLGPYFHEDSIDFTQKQRTDRIIRTKALNTIQQFSFIQKSYFFNLDPEIFTVEEDSLFFQQLTSLFDTHADIHPTQIVLEITETDFLEDASSFLERLSKYRDLGCRIAVDDLGKGFSNLERVALLQPHILKVDLHLVKNSVDSQSHRDVLYALSILSERIGAQLLFEGIETTDQLENAWKNGAQYYQGYLFSKPKPKPIETVDSVDMFHDQLEQMIQEETERLEKQYAYEEELNHLLKRMLLIIPFTKDYNQYVQRICARLPQHCFRVYVCNRLGYQLSGNHLKQTHGRWHILAHYRNKNWSWRPYFLKNIVKMEIHQSGFLSDPYTDIETNELIQTFSFPVREDTYLFIDLKRPAKHKSKKNRVSS